MDMALAARIILVPVKGGRDLDKTNTNLSFRDAQGSELKRRQVTPVLLCSAGIREYGKSLISELQPAQGITRVGPVVYCICMC